MSNENDVIQTPPELEEKSFKLINEGIIFYREKKSPAAAREKFEAAIMCDPNGMGFFYLLNLLINTGNYEQAYILMNFIANEDFSKSHEVIQTMHSSLKVIFNLL